mmetsp:Transcript_23208/g.65742  ORF Transcript_23208/g.65742 Transcript_23208/m.65742 type:complete len:90 (+) Transcript_23208:46-315(+)
MPHLSHSPAMPSADIAAKNKKRTTSNQYQHNNGTKQPRQKRSNNGNRSPQRNASTQRYQPNTIVHALNLVPAIIHTQTLLHHHCHQPSI